MRNPQQLLLLLVQSSSSLVVICVLGLLLLDCWIGLLVGGRVNHPIGDGWMPLLLIKFKRNRFCGTPSRWQQHDKGRLTADGCMVLLAGWLVGWMEGWTDVLFHGYKEWFEISSIFLENNIFIVGLMF